MDIPSTMTKQVSEAEKLEISYRVLHPQAIIQDKDSSRNIQIPYSSLTNKYRHLLSKIIVNLTLDDEGASKYRYKPKTLSEDLYGTTEFWNDLLILNNCTSIMEFSDCTKIKVYDPNSLKLYINEILILEGIVE
jgi:hypothetical protein